MSAQIIHGDCVEVMASLPAESVDAIVTSPPYAEQRKSTYGGIPEEGYPEWTIAWMAEAKRLLKPDGSVIINISPHAKNGQVSDYVLRTRLALRGAGWNEVDELIWHKTNPMPVGHKDRPRRSWESLLWYSKHGRPFSNAKANGKPSTRKTAANKDGQAVRNGWGWLDTGTGKTPEMTRCANVVSMSTGSETTGHPAPFPVPLAEWCGKLICPHGGTILDPFSGSASTGIAAIRNGWDYIGIEAIEEYVTMSRERLAAA